jgi:hypothetical protein
MVPIKYIGTKSRKTDNVAGTDLVWSPGEIHVVPSILAPKFIKYPDVWAVPENFEAEDPAVVGLVIEDSEAVKTVEEEELNTPMVEIPNSFVGFNKEQIAQLAHRAFGVRLDPGALKREEMIDAVRGLKNSRDTFEG